MRLGGFGLLLGALFVVGLLIAPHSARHFRNEFAGLGVWGPLVVIAAYAADVRVRARPGARRSQRPAVRHRARHGGGDPLRHAGRQRGVSDRPGARPAVLWRVAWGRLRDWTARIEGRGFLAVLYARIVPGAPFALISYAAGLTRIRLRDFAGATAIGALPRAFAYAALGGSIGNYSSPQALVAIGVLVAMGVGGAGLLWHARRQARRPTTPSHAHDE